jgi:hypothetical protein
LHLKIPNVPTCGRDTVKRKVREDQDKGWWEREIEPHADTQAHQSENRVPASLGDPLGDDRGEGGQSLRLRRDAGEKEDLYLVLFAYQDRPNSTVEEIYDYLNPSTMPEENISRTEVRDITLALLGVGELREPGERGGHTLYAPTSTVEEDEEPYDW